MLKLFAIIGPIISFLWPDDLPTEESKSSEPVTQKDYPEDLPTKDLKSSKPSKLKDYIEAIRDIFVVTVILIREDDSE